MIRVIYNPPWFYGGDIPVDIISLFVLSIIALFSLRAYRFKKNKNHIKLFVSFSLLSISFFFKIMMNYRLYFFSEQTVHYIEPGLQAIRSSNALFFFGFLFYRLFTLYGLYNLYTLYQKQCTSNKILVYFLLTISTIFTISAYHVFYVTTLILTLSIVWQLYLNYKEKKHPITKMLIASFVVIALSQLFYIFVEVNNLFLVTSEFVQLLGYIGLLITFTMVRSFGKKKIKD